MNDREIHERLKEIIAYQKKIVDLLIEINKQVKGDVSFGN